MEICDRDLHVIAFNVPYPANYGGVIDVYYKIKALADSGIRVHLHCYQYGREESEELSRLCHKVYYYKRKIYKDPFFIKQPYIVATRNTAELLVNLLADDHPILFEGLHCCYYLPHPALANRVKIVRMHNIEHVYYRNLAEIEKNIFKKYFFNLEAQRLKMYENVLEHATAIAAISPDDARVLKLKYRNVFYLPVFHSSKVMGSRQGRGEFALYHGNLGVGENNEAALYLVREVFSKAVYPLVIAGMNPSKELRKAVEGKSHIRLESKLDAPAILMMVQNAHVNILPTFQSTGMKLKLINVLFQGRHCLVNDLMVESTGMEPLCHIASDPAQMAAMLKKLVRQPFTQEDIDKRQAYMEAHFNNDKNIGKLLKQFFPSSVELVQSV